jgi:hypothetical protein
MADQKIVHCMYAEKFIEPFIGFLEKNFDANQHIFLIKKFQNYEVVARPNIKFLNLNVSLFREFITYSLYLNKAQKIIIHGLFNPRLVFTLFLHPWLLKKCYWIMWGGDLYFYELRKKSFKSNLYESVRAFVIKRLGHFVTQIKGDYELAKKWYGSNGQYHESFVYQSNLFKEHSSPPKNNASINILVGNSANPTNNHSTIFEKLLKFKNENIKIYCPLSYGGEENARKISLLGKELFGDKFLPFIKFIPTEEYIELLGKIDIAIFAHKRQQASGNTVTLLGLGKKVYMNSNVTTWGLFSKLGLHIYDLNKLDLNPLTEKQIARNKTIVSDYFSEKNLVVQLKEIFK